MFGLGADKGDRAWGSDVNVSVAWTEEPSRDVCGGMLWHGEVWYVWTRVCWRVERHVPRGWRLGVGGWEDTILLMARARALPKGEEGGRGPAECRASRLESLAPREAITVSHDWARRRQRPAAVVCGGVV